MGVDWTLSNATDVTSQFINNFGVAVNPSSESAKLAASFSFFRLFGSSWTALNAYIEASEAQGDTRIVSSPRNIDPRQ